MRVSTSIIPQKHWNIIPFQDPSDLHRSQKMDCATLEIRVREIIATSFSEKQILGRIADELGYSGDITLLLGCSTEQPANSRASQLPDVRNYGCSMKDSSILVMAILWHKGEMVVVQ